MQDSSEEVNKVSSRDMRIEPKVLMLWNRAIFIEGRKEENKDTFSFHCLYIHPLLKMWQVKVKSEPEERV